MKAMPRPTSIRIFLAEGVSDGLRIVEKSNWTGRAVVAGRAQSKQALVRDELSQPGVYVLTGSSDDGSPQLYIGEADVLRERLRQHVGGNKEFWTRFVAFSSSNEGLNKAHVRYLESRLIELARGANQWVVENATAPSPPPLSEPDRADAEWFLQEMLVIFPLLGIDAFESAASQAGTTGNRQEFPELFLKQRGSEARGREVGDGFVVYAGSRARMSEVASIPDFLSDLRRQLIERGVLKLNSGVLVFTQDFRFNSPSSAAAVVVGGSANGRGAWRDASGKKLKELQEERGSEFEGGKLIPRGSAE